MNRIWEAHATRRPLWLAIGMGFVMLAGTMAMLPVAKLALLKVPPFQPMFSTAVVLVEGLTAYFLAIQFRARRVAFLGAMAGAYLFVMVLAALQILVFPGVFSATGLLGAGTQSAIWIWMMWHGGFPVLVVLALLTRTGWAARLAGDRLPACGLGLLVAGPVLAGLLAVLAIHDGGMLPPLIVGISYHTTEDLVTVRAILAAVVVAAGLCWVVTGLRDLLSLWIAVALLASFCDVVLVTAAGARFSLGWYAGRMLSLLSSGTVLCVLIFEFTRLYGRLVVANEQLALRALRDGLTGAFNRGYLDEQLPRELQRARREQTPVSVLMVDVDEFKRFNDVHGHQRGDECLVRIVEMLRNVARRPGDFVARYGGEEFVVVLPRTDEEGARRLAELARLAADVGEATLSIGVATRVPDAGFDAAEMMARADAALYHAKRTGRNQVCVFQPALALASAA